MATLSGILQRFLSDPIGMGIKAAVYLIFLAVGVGLVISGARYAVSVFKEMSRR